MSFEGGLETEVGNGRSEHVGRANDEREFGRRAQGSSWDAGNEKLLHIWDSIAIRGL